MTIWDIAKGHGQENVIAWLNIKGATMKALGLTSIASLPNIFELEAKYKYKKEVEKELIKMRLLR